LINTPSSKNTQKQNTNLTEVLQKKKKKEKKQETKPGQNPQPTLPTTNRKNKHQPTPHTTKVTHKQKLEKKLCLLLQQRR
jgi:hypothetical protein